MILEKNILTIGIKNNYRAVVVSDGSMSNECYSDINRKWVTTVTHLINVRKKMINSLESKNGLGIIYYNFIKEDVKEAPVGTDKTMWYMFSGASEDTSTTISSSPTKILFVSTS